MKKFTLSLIALAAISSTVLASDRSYDLRDSDTYFGKYATQLKNTDTMTHAIAVDKDARVLTNFERLKNISEENDQGGHSHQEAEQIDSKKL